MCLELTQLRFDTAWHDGMHLYNAVAAHLRWLKGPHARSFVGFLLALNEAVRGKRLGDECTVSPAVEALLKVCVKGI